MKKKIFGLFALLVMASMFYGCSDNDIDDRDHSKTQIVEIESYFDDGISYDGSIAILSKSPEADVEEAAALRFLGGVTSEVNDNTTAVIVEGNPTDFILDIDDVLDRGGVLFIYEPKANDLKEFVNHEYNILPFDEEFIDALELDGVALIGVTLDGDIYTCTKHEMEALETELVKEEQESEGAEEYSHLIEDKGHKDIYDSYEYQMLAGIVEFLEEVENSERSVIARAGDQSKLDFGKIYSEDILVPMRHSYDDHATWNSDPEDIGNHNAVGRFSAKFDITHAYDFTESADYYLVKGDFTAHCGTFCRPTWQPYTSWRRHTVQGDVLRNVTMEAIPIAGNGYSVLLARNAEPMNAPKEKTVNETKGFNIQGSANIGGSAGSEKDAKGDTTTSQEKNGGISVDAGYHWDKTVSYTTHEWTVSNSSQQGNAVGYTIATDKEDFVSKWDGGTDITINPHARGNIDAKATWVWCVRNTEKDSRKKGIEKIRFVVKDLTTQWMCQVQALPSSRTRKEQKYSGGSIDIPLLLTDRTEYGVLKIKNDLNNYMTNITITTDDGKPVFNGNSSVAPGETFSVSLPTRKTYNVLFDAGQKAGQGVSYAYIKSRGEFLSVRKGEDTQKVASVDFADIKDSYKASILLKNNLNATIKFIQVYDVTDGKNKLYWQSRNNGVEAGDTKRLYVDPNRKYIIRFVYKGDQYTYAAPVSQPQYIMLDEAGESVELEADDDFALE